MQLKKQFLWIPSAIMLASLTLVGCGGGGGGGSTASANISGKVIDGYLEGAEVCLDVNANLVCDSNEPKATSAADGSYTLDVTGLTAAQIKNAHLLTHVPTTAKDSDDGGLTLAAAGKSAFSLMAPMAAFVNADGSRNTAVISPFTTLVSHDMISGDSTLGDAEKLVRTRLGLAESVDLRQDFVANKVDELVEKAQILAAAIGEIERDAMAVEGTTENQAFFAALQYLQTQVANLQTAFDAAKAQGDANSKPIDLVKNALKSANVKPDVSDLLAQAKRTTDSSPAVSVRALFEQGMYGIDVDCTGSGCDLEYYLLKGRDEKLSFDQNYELTSNGWKKYTDDYTNDLTLTADGWKPENQCASGQSITYQEDSAGGLIVSFCDGTTDKVSVRTVDASGKKLADLGLNPPTSLEQAVMPPDSQLYWLRIQTQQDEYSLRTYHDIKNLTTATGPSGSTSIGTLEQFISIYQTPETGSNNNLMQWNGIDFTFDKGTTASGNLTLWSRDQNPTRLGTPATYEIKTVHGQKILILNTQAPMNRGGERIIFSVIDGKLYGGEFVSPSAQAETEVMFNKTMINSMLDALTAPRVLD